MTTTNTHRVIVT